MPRDEGFAVADTATDKLDDPKFRRLWRTLKDPAAMNAAVVLHEAVTLKSWLVGERVCAEDAAPFWMLDVDETMGQLQSVGLLDRAGRLPSKSWDSWITPARARRQRSRDNGNLGGRPPKNPQVPNPKPSDNPQVTEPEPTANPQGNLEKPTTVRPSDRPTIQPSGVDHVAALESVTLLSIDRIEPATRREFDRLADQRGSSKVAAAIRDVAERIPTQPPAARQVMVEVLKALEPFSNGNAPKAKGHSNLSDLQAATETF